MKIVDRKTFLAMPAGIVFSKYAPSVVEDLCIKVGNCGEDDFFEDTLSALTISGDYGCDGRWSDKVDEIEQANGSKGVPLDFNYTARDGCFDEDQLFAVFEQHDLDALIKRLQECVGA